MKHVQIEPGEVIVLHKMNLQDLRNCELALMRTVHEFDENAMQNEEILTRLRPSLERVIDAREKCQREEAQKHIADGEQAIVVV